MKMNMNMKKMMKWKKAAKWFHILALGVPLWGCWVEWSSQRGLTEIRRQMRQEGLPLTPADLKRPIPPAARNAAPVYEQLTQLLKAKPLRGDGEVLNEVKRDVPSISSNMQQVRAALSQHQDVIGLVHEAAQKPECNFNRDYGQGYNLLFPEYAPMRSGLRVLTNESALLLYDGKTLDAIRNETPGFQMAQHTNTDSFMIGKLVGVALNAITLRFMERVLYTAGDHPGIAAAVEKAIENNWKTVNMADGIRGEVVVGEVTFAQIANGTLRDDDVKPGENVSPVPHRPPTFVGKAIGDANELYWLQFLHSAIAASALPPSESRAKMDALEHEFTRFDWMPTRSLAAIMFSVYSQALTKQTQGEAQKAVVSAAAAIMAHRQKHGAFPVELAQAVPTVPTDPFDSQTLRYRQEGNGFVVYSVGPTGKFDGGTANKKPGSHESVFRFPMPAWYTQAPPPTASTPAPTP